MPDALSSLDGENDTPCVLVFESRHVIGGMIRELRGIATTEEHLESMLVGIDQEQGHGEIQIEHNYLDHLFGHSMLMRVGTVRRPPDA